MTNKDLGFGYFVVDAQCNVLSKALVTHAEALKLCRELGAYGTIMQSGLKAEQYL